ncbi:hypothetical protein R1flu_002223 [Riccia fluitans]|uniref:Ubiquitin-like protease family profile domain-containing protein n=1 Tax=Riccia fluitans TaxID=41844 RepID=A0ABD1Y5G9_9MARC
MKIKKDGHLVEPLDPNVDAKSQKIPKKKQMGSEQPSRKRPRSESDPKDGNEGNLPSAMETSWKGKGKVTESLHYPDVDTNVDILAEDRRMLKIGMMASRLEMDPPLSTPTGQTSGRCNNHILAGDTIKEAPPTSSKVPSDGILEESVSQMTTVLSNIIEHHARKNQCLASLEEDLAHAKLEEEKLKATIEALEKEKSEMNARVALMERKDLYDLLEAKMEGFQIANHPGTIGVGVSFVRGHHTLQDESIFDSYVNPNNNPNVQPLVKGLDADDFSVDKFFNLQDPTSPDDVQASSDFEEDLRTNECLRLQTEVRNLGAEPQWITRSTRIRLDYEPTILPDVPPTDNPTRPITLDLSVDAHEDPSSPPPSQIVPIPALVDLTQYASSPENEGSEDQGWPRKEDLTKADLESVMYKGCYLREDVINMYINEAFLKKPCKQLHNMFYVNTFWFTKANELVARYDKTNHAEEPMIKITRLQKSICLELHDEDMQGNLPTWISVPIHGKNHWSLAILRLHNDDAWLAHLDSSQGTHDPEAIFHVLKQVLYLIVPIDPALVMMGIMNVEQQQDGHSCGKHVLQMLAGATRKESDGQDRCFRAEGLRYIATLDQVRSFDVVFGMYLSGKLAGPPM